MRSFLVAFLVLILPPLLRADEPYRIRESKITDVDREHWSFRALTRPQLPAVKNATFANNPIGHFVQSRLESHSIEALPAASRVTLIRRLTFDLTGLPPTPEEVRAFLDDNSPTAYEQLVDRLLASPAYGERWAQHWLDLARFAETDGFEHDKVRKDAWRYRDWVINALNRDVPYDDFVRLQLAGDEIRPDKNGTHVATGFLMSGPDMPDINLVSERRHVLLNEMTSTVGSVFLGLTLECAQCHNHKYDPISQADFYRFRALLAGTLPGLKKNVLHPTTVKEPTRKPPAAHFVIRGDFRRPGPVIEPAFLRFANPRGDSVAKPDPGAKSSMRRTALADWLVKENHPLTARVIVNRIWMHHFGRGLAGSPSDFGTIGEQPTHPQLLDWLATELMRIDWSIKKLHRLIVTSAAYRRASRPTNERAMQSWKIAKKKDAANKLLWRMNRTRLSGEAIRDAMLVAAEQLNRHRGGPGVRPPLPKELVETLLRNQWVVSPDESDHYRRSIYVFARRNLRYPIFEAFDRPDGNASCSRRSRSTTAPQALTLLSSKFSSQVATEVAASAVAKSADSSDQVRYCYWRILSRAPTSSDIKTALAFLADQSDRIERSGDAAAIADFCLALFNLNEHVYVD